MNKWMRFLLLLIVLGTAAGCASPTAVPTADSRQAIVEAGFVRGRVGLPAAEIRLGPSVNYKVIGHLQPGDTAQLVGINQAGDWLLINYNNLVGWVYGSTVEYTISE